MRVIPTRVHGMLDYLVGVLLIASPWIFGFADESGTAKWTFVVIGAAMLATSLMTNYELGAIHAIPMHIHLWADAAAGVVLALSPWIFGYANDAGVNGWLPALIIGVGEIGAAAMSNPWPARPDVSSELRLVASRKLAQLDLPVHGRCKVADQRSKVHALRRREVDRRAVLGGPLGAGTVVCQSRHRRRAYGDRRVGKAGSDSGRRLIHSACARTDATPNGHATAARITWNESRPPVAHMRRAAMSAIRSLSGEKRTHCARCEYLAF